MVTTSRRRLAVLAFTLVELLVVMALVALLLTLALPRYLHSVDASKETVLIENLRVTRDAIDKFFADSGRYPTSLDELVEKRYLRALPFDPIIEASDRWVLVAPGADYKGAVADLKSAAEGTARNGKQFGEL